MLKMDGKILLLARPFSYNFQYGSGREFDHNTAQELSLELILYEVKLCSDARDVKMTQLTNNKSVNELVGLLNQRYASVK